MIQGHVFWGQWKGDKGLNHTMLDSFPKVPKTYSVRKARIPENRRFRLSLCRLTARLQGTPTNIPINLTLPETTVIELNLCGQ